MVKRLVRVCEGCGRKRQYYRKKSNTWSCYHCGRISIGESITEIKLQEVDKAVIKERGHELRSIARIPRANGFKFPCGKAILYFIESGDPISYIQFDNVEDLAQFYPALYIANKRMGEGVNVWKRGKLLRIYLVKKTTQG